MSAAAVRRPLKSALRERVRAWALRRQGVDALPLKLHARRVYILPTPAGWTFGLLLIVMFIAGMNYGNGLALLFTFWLAGFSLVAMIQTQRRMTGTRVVSATAEPAHAGDALRFTLQVSGPNPPADLTLQIGDEWRRADQSDAHPGATTTSGGIDLRVVAKRRGRWRAPALHLSSSAPFGLFRTWTWLTPDVSTLIYPAAQGSRPVPETAGESNGSVRQLHGLDELAWLRDFRDGDSPRQVAWKAYARGQPLLVREYHGEGALRHEFDFDALTGLDEEARLAQLTRWIVDAHARGEGWVLKLPASAPLAGSGETHLLQCLTRLAVHNLPESR